MCGKKIHDESKFCPYCGATVGKIKNKITTEDTVTDEKSEELENQALKVVAVQEEKPEQSEKSARVKKGFDPKLIIIPVAAVAVVAGVGIGLGKKNAIQAERQETEYVAEAQTQETEEEAVEEETVEDETESVMPSEESSMEEVSDGVTQGEYILPECETRVYTREELSGLSAAELRLARNEIYARHGRKFSAKYLNTYFSSKSWYTPLYEGEEIDAKGDSILNQNEIANRDLIVELEKEKKLSASDDKIRAGYAGLGTFGVMQLPTVSMPVAVSDDIYELVDWTISDPVEEGEVEEWSYRGLVYVSKNAKFEITVKRRDYFGERDFYEIKYPHKITKVDEGFNVDGSYDYIQIYDLSFLEFVSEMQKVRVNLHYDIGDIYIYVKFDENGIITSGGFQNIAG